MPFADQFNHSTQAWNTRIREHADRFEFVAENNIDTGEETFNNYGVESDIEMWVTHGFVDEGLKDTLICIPISLLSSDSSAVPEDDPIIKIDVSGPDLIPSDLQSLLVLDEFIPPLLQALSRALDRMLSSYLEEEEFRDPYLRNLLEKDRKNCELYRQRLLALTLS